MSVSMLIHYYWARCAARCGGAQRESRFFTMDACLLRPFVERIEHALEGWAFANGSMSLAAQVSFNTRPLIKSSTGFPEDAGECGASVR